MLDEAARLAPGGYYGTQGSWSGAAASAGTHSGCGAIDLMGPDLSAFEEGCRRVGMAAWVRYPNQGPWPTHLHAIAVQPGGRNDRGCLSAAAWDQVRDYHDGYNGLANHAADPGNRSWVGTTWETYQQQAQQPEEDDMGPIIIFHTKTGGKIYAAYPDSGTYRHMPDPGTVKDLRYIAAQIGQRVIDWEGPVGNPAAFGVEIA